MTVARTSSAVAGPRVRRSMRRLLPTILAASVLASCGGGDLALPTTDGAVSIRVVDGDGQSGPAGELLAVPIVVQVTGGDGAPVEGATVEFALTAAGSGAEVQPETATTDADGRAEAHVLLGDKLGLQTGEARVVVEGAPSPKASFTAVATASTPGNQSPAADFDWDCDDLACRFTDTSTDGDGSVAGRSWRFGDGDGSEQTDPEHAYAEAGTYTVTLTVTDDDGATDASSHEVTVTAPAPAPEPNKSPEANFEVQCQELTCTFTDRSDDTDGTLASWAWDFGDGTGSSERSPVHSYSSAGRYTVSLRVRDDDGAEDTRSHEAEAQAPAPNEAPRAEFEVHCNDLTCTFIDKSKDEDGSVVAWQWSFGDGASSSERNPVHVYARSGRYDVLLTVTDDRGAADGKSRRVEADD